ncbi:hypothetical protein A2U01_0098561, partial [Trifolium medium]|nr:hypothetical protein [Trifolium medium]
VVNAGPSAAGTAELWPARRQMVVFGSSGRPPPPTL